MTTPTPCDDMWFHYGRRLPVAEELIPARLYWDWYQRDELGVEVLGDVAGWPIADLGAGAGRQAAYVARVLRPSLVAAVDSSPSQYGQAWTAFRDMPGVYPVLADAAEYLEERPGRFLVCYSVFGAVDFCDPRRLLPAVFGALVGGGRLVFSTLGHYWTGEAASREVASVGVPARRPDGTEGVVERWVLAEETWVELLRAVGFTGVCTWWLVHGDEARGEREVATLVVRAERPA